MSKPKIICFAAHKSSQKTATIWLLSEFFDSCLLIDADYKKPDLSSISERRKKIKRLDNRPVEVVSAVNATEVSRIIEQHQDKEYIFIDTRGALDDVERMRSFYSLADMLILPVSAGIESLNFTNMLKFVHKKHPYRILITGDEGNALKKERAALRKKLEALGEGVVLKSTCSYSRSIVTKTATGGTRLGEGFGVRRGLQEYSFRKLASEIKEVMEKL